MSSPALRRRLGLLDAVALGVGSMIGAGIFAAFAPAAAAAGGWLMVGLVIAGVVAFCNATSSAQLAAQYPSSGGTYVYGRERLGPWPGFLAGWCFVIGKTASCAAMAITFAAYLLPAAWQRPAAVLAVLALTAVNAVGITRTAGLTKIIVTFVVGVLLLVVVAGLSGAAVSPDGSLTAPAAFDLYGVLQAAGLLFFAFAGYARIATLGEEVKNPARTIPLAITVALSIVLVVYAVVAATLLWSLDVRTLAGSSQPLVEVVEVAGWSWAAPIVGIAAAAATLGALLGLIAGIGRTTLAMAREGDLPRRLAVTDPRFSVPRRAQCAAAAVVCVLVLVVDLRGVIGFSSFGVLLYYLIANVAAWTQDRRHRRYPRFLQLVGAVSCVVLVVTLPGSAIVGGTVVVAVGVGYRCLRRDR